MASTSQDLDDHTTATLARDSAITGARQQPRGVRWHLAARQSTGGLLVEYAVYVDGVLVTEGHATGEHALTEAQRLLGGDAEHEAPEALEAE